MNSFQYKIKEKLSSLNDFREKIIQIMILLIQTDKPEDWQA